MAIRKQFAISQVCEISLDRNEVERLVIENLSERGAPGYDFETHRPFVVWRQDGSMTIRYFQSAAFAHEGDRFMSLKPMPTKEEIDALIEQRRKAAQT